MEELVKRKKKLNCCAKVYIFLQKSIIEQIYFIQKPKKLNEVYEELKRGKVQIVTKLEEWMLKDIRELKKQRLEKGEDPPEEFTLEGMKRTKARTTCKALTSQYITLLG
mmetsp:Transcript_4980/g.3605  ORF Transcript_4980/g.3605 Transcript_4980/m.3605 type:complete len:109 (+) Transcript_4980:679-1005(+)